MRVHDLRTGALVAEGRLKEEATVLAVSPDGEQIAVGTAQGNVSLRKVARGLKGRDIEDVHRGVPTAMLYAVDGSLVVAFEDGFIQHFTERGRLIRTFPQDNPSNRHIGVSAEQPLLIAGGNQEVLTVLDLESGEVRATVDASRMGWTHVDISGDGSRIVALGPGTLYLYDTAQSRPLTTQSVPNADDPIRGRITAAAIAPDGITAAWARESGQLQVYSPELVHPIAARRTQPWGQLHVDARFTPDSTRIVTRDQYGGLAVWGTSLGQPLRRIRVDDPGTDMAVSPDSRAVLIGSEDGSVAIWQLASGALLRSLDAALQPITDVAWASVGGRVCALDAAGHLQVWRSSDGERIAEHRPQEVGGFLTLSPDGARALVLAHGTGPSLARLVDLDSGRVLRKFEASVFRSGGLFAPDGESVFVCATERIVRRYSIGGRVLSTFPKRASDPGHDATITAISLSPDGALLATGCENHEICLWRARSGKLVWKNDGHRQDLRSLRFSPDGTWLLSTAGDGLVMLTDVESGESRCALAADDQRWVVSDLGGRYDSSRLGRAPGVHAVSGMTIHDLDALHRTQYEPGLLARVLERSEIAHVSPQSPPPVPTILGEIEVRESPVLSVGVENEGGGIGAVSVHLNGKRVDEDIRPDTFVPTSEEIDLEIDLGGFPQLLRGGTNRVEVRAYNGAGTAQGRGFAADFHVPGKPDDPALWAIICGVSDYAGEAIDLELAAKDAADFAFALRLAAEPLFGEDGVHIQLLTSPAEGEAVAATKANFVAAFEEARACKAEDVFVVYLAGHGVIEVAQDERYVYLLADAAGAEFQDDADREEGAVTATELAELLASVPAVRRQALFIDTCAAGGARDRLASFRSRSKLVGELYDTSGIHVLAGCAADRVAYESGGYGQGLLTYALLYGMRCGCRFRDGVFVDARELINFAWHKVPELAEAAGLGPQQPVALESDETFDLGRLDVDRRGRIPLQQLKPLIVRSEFQTGPPPIRSPSAHDRRRSGRPWRPTNSRGGRQRTRRRRGRARGRTGLRADLHRHGLHGGGLPHRGSLRACRRRCDRNRLRGSIPAPMAERPPSPSSSWRGPPPPPQDTAALAQQIVSTAAKHITRHFDASNADD